MKWIIAVFIVTIVAVKLATGMTPAPPPVINLDANAHTITANVTCLGDNVQKVDIYVDGSYYLSTTNASPRPTGFSIAVK
jgi:proline racemase